MRSRDAGTRTVSSMGVMDQKDRREHSRTARKIEVVVAHTRQARTRSVPWGPWIGGEKASTHSLRTQRGAVSSMGLIERDRSHGRHGPMEGVSTHVVSRVAVYVTVLKVDGAILDVHATTLQRVLAFMRLIHGGHGPMWKE